MIFGYAIERLFVGIGDKKWNILKILQASLVSVVFVFLLISFSFTPAVTMFGQSDIRNPFDYERSFPLKDESINEKRWLFYARTTLGGVIVVLSLWNLGLYSQSYAKLNAD